MGDKSHGQIPEISSPTCTAQEILCKEYFIMRYVLVVSGLKGLNVP